MMSRDRQIEMQYVGLLFLAARMAARLDASEEELDGLESACEDAKAVLPHLVFSRTGHSFFLRLEATP